MTQRPDDLLAQIGSDTSFHGSWCRKHDLTGSSSENTAREGVVVSFWEYGKVGVPLTLLTLLVGIAWLLLVPY